jgi:hypothetical protein
MKYRKKPVVVEAWRWMFSTEQEPAPAWINNALGQWPKIGGIAFWPDGNPYISDWSFKPHIEVVTLEGIMRAQPSDYIIRGVNGELYPCKSDIFDVTYELAA